MASFTGSRRQALAVIGLLCGLGATRAALAETVIRIGGTGSALGTIKLIADAFMQANPELRVVIVPAVGGTGGMNALMAGKLDMALSTREITEATRSANQITVTEWARTPLAIAVHKNLGVTALTSDQLAALFEPGATFANGQRARPVLRLPVATETRITRSISPAVARAMDAASARRGMLEAVTDSEAADMVQQTPGAFAAISLAQIVSERRPFTALALDGREPTLDGLANGNYPYYKRLLAITPNVPADGVAKFLAFLRSPAAQAIVRANGSLPS